jgi:hypothetical protein
MRSASSIVRRAGCVLALACCGALAGPVRAQVQDPGAHVDSRQISATGRLPSNAPVADPAAAAAVDWRADRSRDEARSAWPSYRRSEPRTWGRGGTQQYGNRLMSRRPVGRFGYVFDGRYWWYVRVPYRHATGRAPQTARGDRLRLLQRRQLRPRYLAPRRPPPPQIHSDEPRLLRIPYSSQRSDARGL